MSEIFGVGSEDLDWTSDLGVSLLSFFCTYKPSSEDTYGLNIDGKNSRRV